MGEVGAVVVSTSSSSERVCSGMLRGVLATTESLRPHVTSKLILALLSVLSMAAKLVELPELESRSRSRPPTDRWFL